MDSLRGTPGGTRTPNLSLRTGLLYPIELPEHISILKLLRAGHNLYNMAMVKAAKKAGKKHFKEQFENEDVLLVFRKHPIVMRRGLITAMAALLIGPVYTLILTYAKPENPPSMSFFFASLLLSMLLGLVLIFPSWVRWYFSVYIMTNHRFIQQTRSLLEINVVDIGLEQVQMINYQIRGIQETLLNFGTITVQTYVGDLIIRDVHHPARVQKSMIELLRNLGIHASQKPTTRLPEDDNDQEEEEPED